VTVLTGNQRAVGLYQRSGFQGRAALSPAGRDGMVIDEHHMAKLLPSKTADELRA